MITNKIPNYTVQKYDKTKINKPKPRRSQEIIKIRVEMNKMEVKKQYR